MKLLHMCDYRCNRCRSRNIREHIRGEEWFCEGCYNIQRTGAVEQQLKDFYRQYQKPISKEFKLTTLKVV